MQVIFPIVFCDLFFWGEIFLGRGEMTEIDGWNDG